MKNDSKEVITIAFEKKELERIKKAQAETQEFNRSRYIRDSVIKRTNQILTESILRGIKNETKGD